MDALNSVSDLLQAYAEMLVANDLHGFNPQIIASIKQFKVNKVSVWQYEKLLDKANELVSAIGKDVQHMARGTAYTSTQISNDTITQLSMLYDQLHSAVSLATPLDLPEARDLTAKDFSKLAESGSIILATEILSKIDLTELISARPMQSTRSTQSKKSKSATSAQPILQSMYVEIVDNIFGVKSTICTEPRLGWVTHRRPVSTDVNHISSLDFADSVNRAKFEALSRQLKLPVYVHTFSGLTTVAFSLPSKSPKFGAGISMADVKSSIVVSELTKHIGNADNWDVHVYGKSIVNKNADAGIHIRHIGDSYHLMVPTNVSNGEVLDAYNSLVENELVVYEPLIGLDPVSRDDAMRKNNLWKVVNAGVVKRIWNKKLALPASVGTTRNDALSTALGKAYSTIFGTEILPTLMTAADKVTSVLITEARLTFDRELRNSLKKIEKSWAMEVDKTPVKLGEILDKHIKTDAGMFYATSVKVTIILAKKVPKVQ